MTIQALHKRELYHHEQSLPISVKRSKRSMERSLVDDLSFYQKIGDCSYQVSQCVVSTLYPNELHIKVFETSLRVLLFGHCSKPNVQCVHTDLARQINGHIANSPDAFNLHQLCELITKLVRARSDYAFEYCGGN